MKFHQKVVIFIVVLAIALASVGLIAGVQGGGSDVASTQAVAWGTYTRYPLYPKDPDGGGLVDPLPDVQPCGVSWNG
jgi:hypothetical protein